MLKTFTAATISQHLANAVNERAVGELEKIARCKEGRTMLENHGWDALQAARQTDCGKAERILKNAKAP